MLQRFPVRIILLTLLSFLLQVTASAQWKIFSLDSLSPGPLALDKNGHPHTLSFDESGFVSHVTYTPPGWVRTPLYDGGGRFGSTSALCIDSRGVLHAAFAYSSFSPTRVTSLYYVNDEGGAWNSVQQVLTVETGIGELSMSIDRQNRVHLTCHAASNAPAPGALFYATNASGSWKADSIAKASNGSAIQADLGDSLHVVFYGGQPYGLWHLGKGAGEWSAPEFIDSVGGQREGMGVGMAVDSSNRIHISYVRGGNEDHTYALREGGVWTRTFLDGGQFMAYGTSVAVDRNGHPHVVYYHVASNALKYATNASGVWSTIAIDPEGGMFNRAGIDPNGYQHILYGGGNFPGVRWATTQPLPKLVVRPTAFDFGEVGLGKSALCTLSVRNAGDAALLLSRIDAIGSNRSCFTWVNGCATLAPGDSCEITLLFAPDTVADLTAGLRIFSNDPRSPAKVGLAGKGTGKPSAWAMVLQGDDERSGWSIRSLPDSGCVLLGHFIDSGPTAAPAKVWVVRLSPSGEVLWERIFDTDDRDFGLTMEIPPDHGMVIGGYSEVVTPGNPWPDNAWILRLDSTGHEIWQRRYDAGRDESIRSLHPLTGGGFLAVVSVTSEEDPNPSTIVMRLDDGGSILWQKTVHNVLFSNSSPTSDGGVTLLLQGAGLPLPGTGGTTRYTSMVVDLDAAGLIRWARYIYSELALIRGDITRTADGGVAAFLASTGGKASVVLALDPSGTLLWSRKITERGVASPFAKRIARRVDGGFLAAGGGSTGELLIGLTPSGSVEWSTAFTAAVRDFVSLSDSSILATGFTGSIDPPFMRALVMHLNRQGAIPGCSFARGEEVEDTAFALELRDWTPSVGDGDLTVLPITFASSTVRSTRTLICSLIPVDDVDGDGLADNSEWGPTGFDPTFDGNGDGTPDTEQSNVASFASGVMGQRYVTLASDTGTALKEVRTVSNPSPPTTPGAWFAYDFYSFRITGLAPGDTVTVRLILHGASWPPSGYWKYGVTTDSLPYHWYRFDYDGETGATISGNEITLHFVDGKRGDDDLVANGEILEPGGPGWLDTLALGMSAEETLPRETQLYQNYPNPFNPTTTVAFDLATSTHVVIRIYDLLGREVALLADEIRPAGRHRVVFGARSLASGIYFIRFQGAGRIQTKKMLMIR
jgi:hypothetical protein